MARPLDTARLGDHLDRLYRAACALTGSRLTADDPGAGDLRARALAPAQDPQRGRPRLPAPDDAQRVPRPVPDGEAAGDGPDGSGAPRPRGARGGRRHRALLQGDRRRAEGTGGNGDEPAVPGAEAAHRQAGVTGGRDGRVRRRMNGAESLVGTAAAAGVEVCFANPGTTEMDLVRALDAVGGIRPVLGLFEGVCTAAADGYGRMAGRPALALLHLGPGLANGIANLHNAARARTPLLSVVGEHATAHRARGAPLETDIEGLARPFSTWLRTSASPAEVARDAAAAVAAARSALGGVATLIVPADCAWGDAAAGPAHPIEAAPPRVVSDATVEA